jgi:hypothetical protein
MSITGTRRELAQLRRIVKENCKRIYQAEQYIDSLMQGPSTEDRGRRIAQVMNSITCARQSMLHFGLGIDLKKIK